MPHTAHEWLKGEISPFSEPPVCACGHERAEGKGLSPRTGTCGDSHRHGALHESPVSPRAQLGGSGVSVQPMEPSSPLQQNQGGDQRDETRRHRWIWATSGQREELLSKELVCPGQFAALSTRQESRAVGTGQPADGCSSSGVRGSFSLPLICLLLRVWDRFTP